MSQKRTVAQNAQPIVDYGRGSYVFDKTGKRYIDGSGGPAVYCLGHANKEVNDAIKAQLDRIAHGYRGNFTSDPLEELQSVIAECCGRGFNNMLFVTGGSEAVESCLKLALQYQQAIGENKRVRFIARHRSWHGNTLGALAVSGFSQRRDLYEGALTPASFVSAANAYRPPDGVAPEQLVAVLAAELDREIDAAGAQNVCAFIFEPVVGAAAGAVPAPPGYASAIREVCDHHGVLVIADEVMCGAGRTGTWRALEHDAVEPDIMAVAKGLGGGYIPLGAAIFHDRIAEPINREHGGPISGHTFSGHTTACAGALAVQKIVARDGLLERIRNKGPWLMAALSDELGDHPHVGNIRGRGYFIGVEFVADRATREPFDPAQMVFAQIRDAAFTNGLICYPVGGNVDGVRGDHAILAPPYNASDSELSEIVEKFVMTCRQVLR